MCWNCFSHGSASPSDVTQIKTMMNTNTENMLVALFCFKRTFVLLFILLPFSWFVSQVTGLEESVNYEFRVRGVNDAGVGMTSMPSDPMTAMALAGIVKPKSFFGSFFPPFSSRCRVMAESADDAFCPSVWSRFPGGVLHGWQKDRWHHPVLWVLCDEPGISVHLEERLRGNHRFV